MAEKLTDEQFGQIESRLALIYWMLKKDKLIAVLFTAIVGLAALSGPALAFYFSTASNAQQLVNEKIPDKVVAEFLQNAALAKQMANDYLPVGSIIAWHKTYSGKSDLPKGWEECNGQTLSKENYPDMADEKRKLPDLNSAEGYSGGRFLRGGTESGKFQEGTRVFAGPDVCCDHMVYPFWHGQDFDDILKTGVISDAARFTAATGHCEGCKVHRGATRPVNMSVVWIMRVE